MRPDWRNIRILRSALTVLCVCTLLTIPVAGQEQTGDRLRDNKQTVTRLIEQLDADTLGERDRAAQQLLQMGPSILPLLSAVDVQLSAEATQRIELIRDQLLQIQAQAFAQASRVTLKGEMTLSEALKQLKKQTGNHVEATLGGDRRVKRMAGITKAFVWS